MHRSRDGRGSADLQRRSDTLDEYFGAKSQVAGGEERSLCPVVGGEEGEEA